MIQRFDAQAVAGEEAERAGGPVIVDGEGEHATEAAEESFDTPLFVSVEQDFGITAGDEAVAGELRPVPA